MPGGPFLHEPDRLSVGGKVFAYAMDPVDWLFCGDRRNRLREIGEDRESKESKESGETGKAPENKGKETTIWN